MKKQKKLNLENFEKEVNKLFKVEKLTYEFVNRKTLWIYIISEDFFGIGIQERTHVLTDLLKKIEPKLFSRYLFGFQAYTPKEWELLNLGC